MKKLIEYALRYSFTLSTLAVAITRGRIGMDLFLPFGIWPKSPTLRILLRLLTVILLYFWVRLFFILEYAHSKISPPFPADMTILDLLFDHKPYNLPDGGKSILLLLYYLSFLAPIVGISHLIALEIYYRRGIYVSALSLGRCGIFDRLLGRHIFTFEIDKIVIWTLEALWIFGIGFLIRTTFDEIGLSSLLFSASISTALFTQFLRLELRAITQSALDAGSKGGHVAPTVKKFNEKPKGGGPYIADNNVASPA